MGNRRDLTEEELNNLLAWLDPDRERAARKYQTIYRGLTKIFAIKGCKEPEELADETINRVARKASEVAANYQGDPTNYFFGVAKKVLLEHQRIKVEFVPLPFNLSALETHELADKLEFECLDHCLQKLTPTKRQIVRRYYDVEAGADAREAFAKFLGIKPNALRVKVFRIISELEECMDKCLQRGGPA